MSGPRQAGEFRALGSRPFRLYFAGQVASASGTFVQQPAIGGGPAADWLSGEFGAWF